MAELVLTQGRVAIVDAEDLERLSLFRWHADVNHIGKWYARTKSGPGGKAVFMHRLLLGAEAGQQVDHVNGDGLDNRRSNLRVCTNRTNQQNSKLRSDSRTGFKGVNYLRERGLWRARIRVNGKRIWVPGYFATAEEAAAAYDSAAVIHFGDFARLNFAGPSAATDKEG